MDLPAPSAAEIEHLTKELRRGILAFLRKKGKLRDDDEDLDIEPSAHASCLAGAVQGRKALGPDSGAWTPRLGRQTMFVPETSPQKLSCRIDGFSLHAGVRVGDASRYRLEKFVRYVARPAIVSSRLSASCEGKILYQLKRRWRDGSTHVVFDPITFLERFCALVPRPRFPLVTYHGVLAPAARLRERVVPEATQCALAGSPCRDSATERIVAAEEGRDGARSRARPYHSWATLMQRVFELDVLQCRCGGRRRIIAYVQERALPVARGWR